MSLGLVDGVANPRRDEARWARTPDVVRRKLALLDDKVGTTFAASSAWGDRIRAGREELRTAQAVLRRAQEAATPTRAFGVPGRDPWTGAHGVGVVEVGGPAPPELAQAVTRLTAELTRLEAAHQPLIQRAGEARRLFDVAHRFLDEQPDPAALVVVAVPPVRVADLATELATVRAQLVALAEEAETVARAPVPLTEALERLDQAFNATADGWKPHLAGFFAPALPSGAYRTPLVPPAVLFRPGGVGNAAVVADVYPELGFEGFLVAMLREPLREALRLALKASVPDAKPIPSSDRPKRLAAVAEKRRAVEEHEEAIILTAEATGRELDRRGDADPSRVLLSTLSEAA